MDRNTFTGLFLIMVILGGAVFFMQPSEAERKKEQALQDSIALVKKTGTKAIATTTKPIYIYFL